MSSLERLSSLRGQPFNEQYSTVVEPIGHCSNRQHMSALPVLLIRSKPLGAIKEAKVAMYISGSKGLYIAAGVLILKKLMRGAILISEGCGLLS